MTLQLPYDGIGAPLPQNPLEQIKELQRRLEAIQGNFLELAGSVSTGTFNRRLDVPTEESTSSTSYTTLTTSDRLNNVWVPSGGVLAVLYHATWKSSVAGAGRAAIFLGSNQLKTRSALSAGPVVQETSTHSGLTNTYQVMGSYPAGLICEEAVGTLGAPGAYTGDVTTGQAAGGPRVDWYFRDSADGLGGGALTQTQSVMGAGGPCHIFGLPAGTYSISVQFRATSGSVTVKNRHLWSWPLNF